MNIKAVFTLVFIISFCKLAGQDISSFEMAGYYHVFATSDLDEATIQLDLLQKSSIADKEAYEGALLMKMAGLVSGPGKKLSMFKSGREKLEKAIVENGKNPEFRFLRLMIQENAPKILGYYDNVEEDSVYVLQHVKELPKTAKDAVVDYSKRSEVLNGEVLREALE